MKEVPKGRHGARPARDSSQSREDVKGGGVSGRSRNQDANNRVRTHGRAVSRQGHVQDLARQAGVWAPEDRRGELALAVCAAAGAPAEGHSPGSPQREGRGRRRPPAQPTASSDLQRGGLEGAGLLRGWAGFV